VTNTTTKDKIDVFTEPLPIFAYLSILKLYMDIPWGGKAEHLSSWVTPLMFFCKWRFFVTERSGVQIYSEIGRIKRIMLYRPGRELLDW